MKLFNFPTRNQNSPLSDDVIQHDSVEICREEDGGCGYSKENCVCALQKKAKTAGPSEIGSSDIGRGFGANRLNDE